MRRWPTLLIALLMLVPAAVGDDDAEEADGPGDADEFGEDGSGRGASGAEEGEDASSACADIRGRAVARAEARLRQETAEAEAERDEELADADDPEDRAEAWGEHNETVAEARADRDRDVARAHDEFEDCRRDAARDDVEVEDDEDGFRYRSRDDHVVAVDAGQARSRVEATSVRFEARIDAVLEYRDEDGNGAYDLGEPVVQRFVLRDAPATVRGDGALRIVSYVLGNGSLELRYRPSGEDTKFDVVIDAFPFAAQDTRLAVGSSAVGGGGLRVVEVDGAPAVAGTGDGSVGFLSWVQHVEVDGAVHPVGWSVHVSQSEARQSAIIYWSYPAGDHVVHDPVLGVTRIPVEHLGDARVFAATAAAAVVVAALGYAWRRRFAP